jgi:hypothetical protein
MKKSITLGIVAATLLLSGTAFGAAQTKPQQKCINTLNKAMAKVAGTQNKANAKCAKTIAKTGSGDYSMCASTDAKVDKIAGKTCPAETKACTTAPEFGSTSCSTVNSASEYNAGELGEDVFDSTAGIALCSSDKPACKCQGKAFKGANKLFKAYQKEFNKCKKGGLKSGTIVDIAGMNACMSTDAKLKISKAETKLDGAVTKLCVPVTTPFTAGACMGLNDAMLTECLVERVRCRHCLVAALSDDLTLNCDIYDNDSDEGSCFDDF